MFVFDASNVGLECWLSDCSHHTQLAIQLNVAVDREIPVTGAEAYTR